MIHCNTSSVYKMEGWRSTSDVCSEVCILELMTTRWGIKSCLLFFWALRMSLRLLKCAVSVVMLLVHRKPLYIWIRVSFSCWGFSSTLSFQHWFWLKIRFLWFGNSASQGLSAKSLECFLGVEKIRCKLCSSTQVWIARSRGSKFVWLQTQCKRWTLNNRALDWLLQRCPILL